MIKQRLKRLVSVVAAAAIAISALCAPIGAEEKEYRYYINLDRNGNIASRYDNDCAQVDLATPMDSLEFIQAGETYNKLPTVYPWEELSVAVWRGDSGGNGALDLEQTLVNGKIAESTMDIDTSSYGRYIKVSKTNKAWSMTIPCKDLNGDSLDDVTISRDVNGDVSTGTFDFDSGAYHLYRDTGNSALFYVDYVYDANSLFSAIIKGTHDAEDQDWAASYVLKDFSLNEINITASPLTCGTKLSDIDFSYSTLPSFTGLSFSEKKVFDADGVELSDSVSLIGGATYKVCTEIELDTAALTSRAVIKINGENLTRAYDEQYSGSSGYYIGSGTLSEWYTFTVDHDVTLQKGKPATCTQDGYKDYLKCKGCNKLFVRNDDGTRLIEISGLTDPLVKISALGHDRTLTECDGHKAATCTEDGYGKYYKCESCGQLFSDKTDITKTIGSSVDNALLIPKTGHNATKHDAKPGNCTERGNIEYWQCNNEGCGKYFLTEDDADNDNSTLWAYITLPSAHTYTNDRCPNGKYESSNNTYHNRVCLICDFVDIEQDEKHTFNGNVCSKCGYQKPAETTAATTTPAPVTTTTPAPATTTTTTPATTTTTAPAATTTTTPAVTITTAPAITTTTTFKVPEYSVIFPTVTSTRVSFNDERIVEKTTTTTAATTTTPIYANENEPRIKGKNGASGWDAIIDEIRSADKGDTIHIDMNGTTVLPESVIWAIKGRDINLELDMGNGFTWTINGTTVTNPHDVDLAVKKGSSSIPVKVINALTGECTYVTLSLEYDGDFGFTATLQFDAGDDVAGLWANLYWYIPQSKAFEFMDSGKINKNRQVKLTFTHASEYVIVLDDHNHGAKPADGDVQAEVVTDDDNPHTGVVVSFSAVILAGAVAAAATKKKKN